MSMIRTRNMERQGYSLIELLVSLVIAAILYFLTLAVVFIRWYRRTAPGYREGRSVGQ